MGKVEEARKKLLLANRSWGDKPGTVLPVISAKEHTETERIDRAQHSPPSISRSLSPLSSLTDSDVDGSPFTDVALVNTTVTAGVTSSKRQRLVLDYVEVPNASYKLSQSSFVGDRQPKQSKLVAGSLSSSDPSPAISSTTRVPKTVKFVSHPNSSPVPRIRTNVSSNVGSQRQHDTFPPNDSTVKVSSSTTGNKDRPTHPFSSNSAQTKTRLIDEEGSYRKSRLERDSATKHALRFAQMTKPSASKASYMSMSNGSSSLMSNSSTGSNAHGLAQAINRAARSSMIAVEETPYPRPPRTDPARSAGILLKTSSTKNPSGGSSIWKGGKSRLITKSSVSAAGLSLFETPVTKTSGSGADSAIRKTTSNSGPRRTSASRALHITPSKISPSNRQAATKQLTATTGSSRTPRTTVVNSLVSSDTPRNAGSAMKPTQVITSPASITRLTLQNLGKRKIVLSESESESSISDMSISDVPPSPLAHLPQGMASSKKRQKASLSSTHLKEDTLRLLGNVEQSKQAPKMSSSKTNFVRRKKITKPMVLEPAQLSSPRDTLLTAPRTPDAARSLGKKNGPSQRQDAIEAPATSEGIDTVVSKPSPPTGRSKSPPQRDTLPKTSHVQGLAQSSSSATSQPQDAPGISPEISSSNDPIASKPPPPETDLNSMNVVTDRLESLVRSLVEKVQEVTAANELHNAQRLPSQPSDIETAVKDLEDLISSQSSRPSSYPEGILTKIKSLVDILRGTQHRQHDSVVGRQPQVSDLLANYGDWAGPYNPPFAPQNQWPAWAFANFLSNVLQPYGTVYGSGYQYPPPLGPERPPYHAASFQRGEAMQGNGYPQSTTRFAGGMQNSAAMGSTSAHPQSYNGYPPMRGPNTQPPNEQWDQHRRFQYSR